MPKRAPKKAPKKSSARTGTTRTAAAPAGGKKEAPPARASLAERGTPSANGAGRPQAGAKVTEALASTGTGAAQPAKAVGGEIKLSGPDVTDEDVERAVAATPGATSVVLSNCPKLTPAAVKVLLPVSGTLLSLDLRGSGGRTMGMWAAGELVDHGNTYNLFPVLRRLQLPQGGLAHTESADHLYRLFVAKTPPLEYLWVDGVGECDADLCDEAASV